MISPRLSLGGVSTRYERMGGSGVGRVVCRGTVKKPPQNAPQKSWSSLRESVNFPLEKSTEIDAHAPRVWAVRLRPQRPRVGGRGRVHIRSVARPQEPHPRRRVPPRRRLAALPRLFPSVPDPRARVAPARAVPASRGRQVRDEGRSGRRRAEGSSRGRQVPRQVLQLSALIARRGIRHSRRRAHPSGQGPGARRRGDRRPIEPLHPRDPRARSRCTSACNRATAAPTTKARDGAAPRRSSSACTANCSSPGGYRCAWR